jgi:LPXTG-motif cell wall-anchored protein
MLHTITNVACQICLFQQHGGPTPPPATDTGPVAQSGDAALGAAVFLLGGLFVFRRKGSK